MLIRPVKARHGDQGTVSCTNPLMMFETTPSQASSEAFLAWYLVALVVLRSDGRFTLPIGLQTFFQQNQTDWAPVMACAVIMLAPPVLVFAALNRYFSVGGIGGSLVGT